MFVYVPPLPTRLARISTEVSFSAKDPWNQNHQAVFDIDNYLVVVSFAQTPQIKIKPKRLERIGGYRRAIRSRTDGIARFLPESLAELWSSKQVPSDALAFLLHEIKPMLKKGDYVLLLHNRWYKLGVAIQSFCVASLPAAAALSFMVDVGAGALPDDLIAAITIAATGATFWLLFDYLYFRRKRRRVRQMQWLLDRHRLMPAERAAAAPSVATQSLERDARPPSGSRAVTRTVGASGKLVTPRRPRAHIVYEAMVDGAQSPRELPFVVGVLGDFSGDPSQPIKPFSDRKFIPINMDNFNAVMGVIGPGLDMRLENTLAGDGSEMEVRLSFRSIEDFEPEHVLEQVPSLKALLETRNKLRGLLGNVDRSNDPEDTLEIPQEPQEIADIDRRLSAQLNAIMHSAEFLKLEGTWRGLHYLVINSETGINLKISLLNVSKRDLYRDLSKAANFDQSRFFEKVYSKVFGFAEGEPFGILIGDYEWTNHPDDLETLRQISYVAAAAFSPFISAASPRLLGLEGWSQLSKCRDLSKIFASAEYAHWRSFRDSNESRFVCLVVPRVLARVPYGKTTKPIEAFDYEETSCDVGGGARARRPDEYCWMNAAYVMGLRMTDAFDKTGFCIAIRGPEGGGRVEHLPNRISTTDSNVESVTEIGIDGDRDDVMLQRLGFLPLLHIKNTDSAVFFSSSTANRPRIYDRPEVSADAAIYARLPCVMATSRFVHYLILSARDKLFSRMEAGDCEKCLNVWINNYVDPTEKAGAQSRAAKPLRAARVEVLGTPGQPGCYIMVAYLRPWLQMEELFTAVRIVARIPTS